MEFQNLSKNVKVTRVMTSQVAGTSDTLSGTTLDMQGFDGVLFIASFGAITANAVTTLKAQQDTAAGMGTAQDLLGTGVSIDDDEDTKALVLDIYQPLERYVRCQIVRATANAVVDGVIAIQYGARVTPTTNDSTTVADTELHVSPAEGTA